jgi:phosphatidate cytidylyltransferase
MTGLGGRVAVAVPLAVIALFAVYQGGWVLVGLALVGGLVATHEFCAMTRELRPLTIAGFAGAAAVIVAVHQGGLIWGLAALFGTLVVAFWLSAVADVAQTATVQLAVTLFGVCWIGYGLGFLVAVRDAPGPDDWGRQLLFAVVGTVWASDIFAYFAGRMFGRRKLAPVISPNKTVEGLLAGLVFGTAVGFFVLYDQPSSDPVTAGQALMLAAAIAIASPVGDLFESYVKRDMQVKDAGTLLGGHGGVLDRIDALLFAGVAVYFVALAIDRA